MKSGGRWIDAPEVYGPRKTLYNRFVRWAAKGVWVDIFHALATAGGPPAQVLIDSSAVKAHRCASGGKGGTSAGHRPIARRADHEDPCSDRRRVSSRRVLADRGQIADCTAGAVLLDRCHVLRSCTAIWVMTAMPSADRSRERVRCRTSRPRRTDTGRTASRPSSIEAAMPSSVCSVA
ncbi:putative transposase [Nitrobacter sp. Nb-311A]|nr:putative transposase [Nitrobacter sp. Nb-311A]